MDRLSVSRAAWRKSSSSGQNGNCVEIAQVADGMAFRDSKDPAGPTLALSAGQWAAFVHTIKAGTHEG